MDYSPLHKILRRLGRTAASGDFRTRRDRVVSRRLQDTFDRDLELARVNGLHVFVQNCVVTLYGTVRHDLDKELIVSIARGVPGVKGVVENLQLVETRFRDAELPGKDPSTTPDS